MSVNGIAQENKLNVMAEALKKISFFTLRSTTSFQKRLNLFFEKFNMTNSKIRGSTYKPKYRDYESLQNK